MVDRFLQRAETRDPAIERDIAQLYFDDSKYNSVAAMMVDKENFAKTAEESTVAYREYMAREGVQQYRDYYEDAPEELAFFEYLDNLSNRDQIRFMEIFEDFTVSKLRPSGYALIPKREFNPEISAFSNLLLDLVDFKDRVRPMAHDIARHDAALQHQKHNVTELRQAMAEFKEGITEGSAAEAATEAPQSVEEGYSTPEIAAESEAEVEAAAEPEAAEPDLEAVVEDTPTEDEAPEKKE